MRKTFAVALMLAASLGLAACDKKSEDKAQDAAQHSEQAQEKMNEAQDKVNEAAKENAEAAKAQAAAEQQAVIDACNAQDGMQWNATAGDAYKALSQLAATLAGHTIPDSLPKAKQGIEVSDLRRK